VKKITTKNGFSAACAHLGGMKCVPFRKAMEHLYVIIVIKKTLGISVNLIRGEDTASFLFQTG
jgi:hypothetical protein